MKLPKLAFILLTSITTYISAAEPPKMLSQYFDSDKEVRGEIVKVDIPGEFLNFQRLLKQVQIKHPEWFKEQQEKAGENNIMLPYDAKLGIKKEEYNKYKALWDKRKFKRVDGGEVSLMLTEDDEDNWVINVFAKKGISTPFTTISYSAKEDTFKSGNGTLVRIDDIKSPKESVYGEWNGYEWRYFDDGSLVKVKENVAIGRTGDGRYGILIHSLQELSGRGTPLADSLLIIRFVPKKLKK